MSNLDALRSLTEVVRCGSVSEAARRLGLSRPAVAGHLKQLEERVGRPLTRGEGRNIEPTALAREFAARTGPAMDLLAETLEDASEIAARPVRIGGPRFYLVKRAIPLLATREEAPMRVVFETSPSRLAEMMEDGELDLGVFSARPDPARLDSKELELDRPVLVGHPKFAELAGKPLVEILQSAPALTQDPRMTDLARHMQEGLDEPRLAWRAPPPAVVVPDAEALLIAARMGAGVAAAPLHLAEEDLESGALVRLDDVQAPASILRLGWLRAGRLTASARQVRDLLVSEGRAYEDTRTSL